MATRLPGRSLGVLGALVLCCSGISPAGQRDAPAYTFRANPSEVRLSFAATDQNRHGVATLQAADFVVVDGDIVIRDFESFQRSDWTHLEIAILVDASESITPAFRKEIADTLELLSQTGGIPEESLSVFSFQGVKPVLLCGGNCRTTDANGQLLHARSGGFTPLFDAIVLASQFLAERAPANTGRVLILFSDGEDTISRKSLSDALSIARDNNIQIYPITLRKTDAPHGATVLRTLASATGGQAFSAATGPRQALDSILEDFHATYIVTYRLPTRAAGFHSVRILPTHNLNLQFRSRSGYFYPARAR